MCVSNLPSLPWNITGKVRKIRRTLKRRSKLSSVLRETVASTMRENPGLLEKQQQRQRQQQQSYVNKSENKVHYMKKEILREDRIWTTIPGYQKCKGHSFETLTFKYVWFDTMMNATTEEARATHWDVVLPVLSRKFQNKLGGEFTYEELVHYLHRRRFRTRFEICKGEDGELSDSSCDPKTFRRDTYSIKTDGFRDDSLQGVQFINHVDIEHEINNLLQELDS